MSGDPEVLFVIDDSHTLEDRTYITNQGPVVIKRKVPTWRSGLWRFVRDPRTGEWFPYKVGVE